MNNIFPKINIKLWNRLFRLPKINFPRHRKNDIRKKDQTLNYYKNINAALHLQFALDNYQTRIG